MIQVEHGCLLGWSIVLSGRYWPTSQRNLLPLSSVSSPETSVNIRLNGATSQKTAILILVAVRSSDRINDVQWVVCDYCTFVNKVPVTIILTLTLSLWSTARSILVFWLWVWDWRLTELRPLFTGLFFVPGWLNEWKNFFLIFGNVYEL
jgi:hypothetical protein